MLGKDSRWVERFTFGFAATHCWVIGDDETGGCVVVDPGQDGADAVVAAVQGHGVRCEAVLLTHGHWDHLWSAPDVAERLDAPVFLHPDDRYLWDNPAAVWGPDVDMDELAARLGLTWRPPSERLQDLTDGQRLSFAGFELVAAHTPGHTPGHVTFLVTNAGADDPALVAGDLVFAGSVGRTDFWRSSTDALFESIQRTVLPLDDAVQVWPGHGDVTTVGRERATNPFLRGLQPLRSRTP